MPDFMFNGARTKENIKTRSTLNANYNERNQFGLDPTLTTNDTNHFNYRPTVEAFRDRAFNTAFDTVQPTRVFSDSSGVTINIYYNKNGETFPEGTSRYTGLWGGMAEQVLFFNDTLNNTQMDVTPGGAYFSAERLSPTGGTPKYAFAYGNGASDEAAVTGQRMAWGVVENGSNFGSSITVGGMGAYDIPPSGEPGTDYDPLIHGTESIPLNPFANNKDKPTLDNDLSDSGWYNWQNVKVAGSESWTSQQAKNWLMYGSYEDSSGFSAPTVADLGDTSNIEDQRYTDRWGNVWKYTPGVTKNSNDTSSGDLTIAGTISIETYGAGAPDWGTINIPAGTISQLNNSNVSPLQYFAQALDDAVMDGIAGDDAKMDLYNAQIMFLNAGWKPAQVNEYFARNADDLLSDINNGSLTFDQFKAQYYDSGTLQSYVRSEEKIRQKFAEVAETADVTYDATGNPVAVNPISYIPTQAQIDALSTEGKISLDATDIMSDSMLTAAVATVVDENTVSKTEAENAIKDYVESKGGVFNADDWTDEITELRTIISQEEFTTTEYQRDELGALVLDEDGRPIEIGQTVVQEGKTAAEILATDVATLVPDRYIGTNDVQTAFAAAGIDFSDFLTNL
jgi:hypothetical protein